MVAYINEKKNSIKIRNSEIAILSAYPKATHKPSIL